MASEQQPKASSDHAGPSVSRCVCMGVDFDAIVRIAGETGGGLSEAYRQTGCGARCGLCLPYIQLAIRTGKTSFPVMWAEDFEKAGVGPGRISHVQHQIQAACLTGRHAGRDPRSRRTAV